jgi:hypothetical protein
MDTVLNVVNWILANFGEALIAMLVGYMLILLKRYVALLYARFEAGLSQDDRYLLEMAVEHAMRAVEQIAANQQVKMIGLDKRKRAIEYAQKLLDEWGVEFSVATLGIIIEAKVRELFNEEREPSPTVSAG